MDWGWIAGLLGFLGMGSLVQQTPAERALYLAKKQWLEGKDDADAQLLPFCSHFAPQVLGASGAESATAAIERVPRANTNKPQIVFFTDIRK